MKIFCYNFGTIDNQKSPVDKIMIYLNIFSLWITTDKLQRMVAMNKCSSSVCNNLDSPWSTWI